MTSNYLRLAPLVLSTAMALLSLTGCGAGLANAVDKQALPTADASQYQPLLDYCGASTPPQGTDWNWQQPYHSTNGNLGYQSSTVASANGNSNVSTGTMNLSVAVNDYRGVSGQYVANAAADGAAAMGVSIAPLFGPQSVACVSPVSRFQAPPPSYTDVPVDPRTQLPTLVWSSYWNHNAVPVAQAGGYAVDAFEFVSNFAPSSSSVFFTVPKSRFASAQNMPVCFLAPHSAQWSCSQPTITDQSDHWTLSLSGAQQGVYLLKSFFDQ